SRHVRIPPEVQRDPDGNPSGVSPFSAPRGRGARLHGGESLRFLVRTPAAAGRRRSRPPAPEPSPHLEPPGPGLVVRAGRHRPGPGRLARTARGSAGGRGWTPRGAASLAP